MVVVRGTGIGYDRCKFTISICPRRNGCRLKAASYHGPTPFSDVGPVVASIEFPTKCSEPSHLLLAFLHWKMGAKAAASHCSHCFSSGLTASRPVHIKLGSPI